MFEILAHRGNWGGAHNIQNTLESVQLALAGGFGLELDLRLWKNEFGENIIVVSHDSFSENTEEMPQCASLEDILVAYVGSSMFKNTVAFHIKDNAALMRPILARLLPDDKFFFFGLNKDDRADYADIFGWDKVAYEFESGGKGNVKEMLEGREGVAWFVDFNGKLNLELITVARAHGKNAYMVTPEVVGESLEDYKVPGFIDGICTDIPYYFKYVYKSKI